MRHRHVRAAIRLVAGCLVAVLVAGLPGCGRRPQDIAEPVGGKPPVPPAGGADTADGPRPDAAVFEPPAREQLDRDVTWIDRPVRDALDGLREEQAKTPPACSPEVALALRNDSAETNARILSALGRLPAEGEADMAARIDRHWGGEVGSTNPLMISSTYEFELLDLTGFGLFSTDRSMETFASAETVTSWQSSADGLMDKVVLRDDLTWSDGAPITAHDVAFTYRVIMDPRVPVPAVRSGTDKLRGVHAYDDRTVVFFHREPLATNIGNINFPILPRHVYARTWEADPSLKDSPEHVALEERPVCGGAYEIVSRKRGREVVLARRRGWSHAGERQVRAEPFFKEVRFRVIEDPNTALLALKAGEIEEMLLNPEQWTTQTGGDDFYERNTKGTAPEWVCFHFAWNIQTPFFADRRVRRAMSFAFDHQRMLDTLCHGLNAPSTGIFPPGAWMASRKKLEPYRQNLDKAEALLDDAGWIDHDGDGIRDKQIDGRLVPFEFTVLVSQQPFRIALCTLLKENLEQIGVTVNVRPLEVTALQDLTQKRNFQACLSGWGSGTDPDTTENIWKTGEMRNFVGYSNPEVDRLFVEGRRELDRDKRAEKYARIQEILYEDQPYTWLFWRNGFYGFSKRLRGYVISPRGLFNYSPGFQSIWKPRQE